MESAIDLTVECNQGSSFEPMSKDGFGLIVWGWRRHHVGGGVGEEEHGATDSGKENITYGEIDDVESIVWVPGWQDTSF